MKSILVHISGGQGQTARIQASLDIARAFSGQLTLCQPAPPPVVTGGLAPGTLWATVSFEDIEVDAQKRREETKQETTEMMRQEDVPWDWADVRGFTQEAFVSQTPLADLAVVTLAEEDYPFQSNTPFLTHVVTNAASPVLAIPQDAKGFDPFGNVLIGWDGSFEAARAVKAALPMLQKANSVMAVTIGTIDATRPDLSDLARYLSRADVHIEADTIPPEGQISTRLIEHAKAIGASYIVMGAYGHSRILEIILGGETQRMLEQSQIPVFFAH